MCSGIAPAGAGSMWRHAQDRSGPRPQPWSDDGSGGRLGSRIRRRRRHPGRECAMTDETQEIAVIATQTTATLQDSVREAAADIVAVRWFLWSLFAASVAGLAFLGTIAAVI